MNLTRDEILRLLKLLDEETVVEPSDKHPFRITQTAHGYRKGADGKLQAKLSVMLEAATLRERGPI